MDATQKALREQEHCPWEEATWKAAVGQDPPGKRADDSSLEPPSKEKRSKKKHDPVR